MESQPEMDESTNAQDGIEIYKEIEAYDWAADVEFKNGLQSILGSTANPAEADHLISRAKCFYFSRKKNIRIDFGQYLAWRTAQSVVHTANSSSNDSVEPLTHTSLERRASVAQQNSTDSSAVEPPAPYPTSFEQIVELISTGQPISGIKDIPDTVLEGQASQTTASERKKPWEKNDTGTVSSKSVTEMQVNVQN